MKKVTKIFCTLAVLSLLLSFAPPAVRAEGADSPAAAEKDTGIALTVSGQSFSERAFHAVTDSDYYSMCRMRKGSRMSFHAASPVRTLYFIFDRPCRWSLTLDDGTVIEGGENGFLHDAVALPREITDFSLDAETHVNLCDVYAFTEGSLPDWVQVWQPPCERADLLVMPTHSDDELLWFGGLLPYYAGELGYKVQVVYLTNHNLTTFRHHEMLNALWTVGVRNYPVQGEKFTDTKSSMGGLKQAASVFGYDNVLAYQVETLRRFSPKVIVAHDINGEYGHGAHKLNAATLLEALNLYRDPAIYPESAEKYGIHRIQKCYLHLWKENTVFVDWNNIVLSRFGGRTAMEMAKTGYLCHESQQKAYQVAESGKYDCRQFGLAYTTVGDDTPGRNDMFENVDMSDSDETADSSEVGSGASGMDDSHAGEKSGEKTAKKVPVYVLPLFALSGLAILTVIGKSLLTGKGKSRRES